MERPQRPQRGDRFDSSFTRSDSEQRARHGLIWTDDEESKLDLLYEKGYTLKAMCETMKRPAEGVLAKLVKTGCLRKEPSGQYEYRYAYEYRYCRPVSSVWVHTETPFVKESHPTTETTEETTMNPNAITAAANFETKNFIRGMDASGLSDAEIFKLIAKLEGEAAALGAIKVKSVKLDASIQKLKEDVVSLANYVDSREG